MKQGWEVKKLGEVLSIERGGSPRPIKKYLTNSSDGINWIKISDATASDKYIYETKEKITKDGLHKTRIVNEGDFILSNSMSFGRPYIMKTTGCIHDGWLVLKQNGKKIFETEFLYYLLSSPFVFQQFNSKAAGSTVRNLNIALVSSVNVPTPPLPEQKRIVAILDKAFAAIAKAKANAEQNLKNAKELFESYLQGVFENRGEGWEEKMLGEVCSLITDGKHGNCENENNSGYYFLSAKDVRNNTLLFDNGRQITKKDFLETHQRTDLKPGDICLINTGATIGRISFAPDDPRTIKTTFQKSVAVIKTIENLIDNHFCRYLLVADLKKLVKVSSGTAVPNLLLGDLRKHKIHLPKSLIEQKSIVKKLDALSAETKKLEAIYQQKIEDLEELKKSVLQKAFNGEL